MSTTPAAEPDELVDDHRQAKRRAELDAIREQWLAAWPRALSAWSKFTRLSEPRWCFTKDDELAQHLTGSFAMIRLTDQAVVISVRQIQRYQLERFAVEVLAHEIGHHVYVPGSMLEQGRMLARMRRGLPGKEQHAPLIANLYADLLLNDRLHRDVGLDMAAVYRAIAEPSEDKLWNLYVRIYEILWSLPRETLTSIPIERKMEGDAQLGARLVRSYSRDWLQGSGKFAALCLPYLMDDDGQGCRKAIGKWLDTETCGH